MTLSSENAFAGWKDARCFNTTRSLAPTASAETRPLPFCPCLAPSSPFIAGRRWLRSFPCGKFEQGFLDRHGPAQVGLSPPFDELHRLRLS